MTEEQLKAFTEQWVAMLWHAMSATGHGYHHPSLRNNGTTERRGDKVDGEFAGTPWLRRYNQRYACPTIRQTPRQLRRARAAAGMSCR